MSYRRSDNHAAVGRIIDRLAAHYGERAVSTDIDNIPLGVDFRRHIYETLQRTKALIAVIGPNWTRQRKIFDQADPVRLELELALHRHILLLPVLVHGAAMPSAADLPPSLKPLANLNALTIHSGLGFNRDMKRLTDILDRQLRLPPAAIACPLPQDLRPDELRAESVPPSPLPVREPPRAKSSRISSRPSSVRRAPSAKTVGKTIAAAAAGAAGVAIVAAAPAAAATVAVGAVAVAGGAALIAASVAAAKGLVRIAGRRRASIPTDTNAENAPALQPVGNGEDNVTCSVFATARPQRGRSIQVQAVLHRAEQLAAAAQLAKAADAAANRKASTKLTKRIRRGTPVQFLLEIPSLEIDQPLEEAIWRGEAARVGYTVHVPPTAALGPCQGTLHMAVNGVPVGEVLFKLTIGERTVAGKKYENQKPGPVGEYAVQFAKAFVSYSRKDAHDVLLYAEALADCGIKVLFDLTDIEPGEEWEPKLFNLIDDADVFYLMWSSNATQSKWVDIESRAALARHNLHRVPRIRPVVIDTQAPDPPDHLARFQFNSKWLSLRQAQALKTQDRPRPQ